MILILESRAETRIFARLWTDVSFSMASLNFMGIGIQIGLKNHSRNDYREGRISSVFIVSK